MSHSCRKHRTPLPRVDRRPAPPGAPSKGSAKGQRPLRHPALAAGLPSVHAAHDEGGRGAGHERQDLAHSSKLFAINRPTEHEALSSGEVNRRLSPVYNNEYIFRKLKLGGCMRRQITEARLLKRLEKLFEKRSRNDNRDRGLEQEAAPQVQRARQGK